VLFNVIIVCVCVCRMWGVFICFCIREKEYIMAGTRLHSSVTVVFIIHIVLLSMILLLTAITFAQLRHIQENSIDGSTLEFIDEKVRVLQNMLLK